MKWRTFFLLNLRWLNPKREGIHSINPKNVSKFFLSFSYAIFFVLLLYILIMNAEVINWIKSYPKDQRIFVIFFLVEGLVWALFGIYKLFIFPMLTAFYKKYVQLDVILFSLLILFEVCWKIIQK